MYMSNIYLKKTFIPNICYKANQISIIKYCFKCFIQLFLFAFMLLNIGSIIKNI